MLCPINPHILNAFAILISICLYPVLTTKSVIRFGLLKRFEMKESTDKT